MKQNLEVQSLPKSRSPRALPHEKFCMSLKRASASRPPCCAMQTRIESLRRFLLTRTDRRDPRGNHEIHAMHHSEATGMTINAHRSRPRLRVWALMAINAIWISTRCSLFADSLTCDESQPLLFFPRQLGVVPVWTVVVATIVVATTFAYVMLVAVFELLHVCHLLRIVSHWGVETVALGVQQNFFSTRFGHARISPHVFERKLGRSRSYTRPSGVGNMIATGRVGNASHSRWWDRVLA